MSGVHDQSLARARVFRFSVAALGLLLLVVAGLVHAFVADAAGPRALTVQPDIELGNQVVRVQWSGFTPTDPVEGFPTVTVLQCKESPESLSDCHQDIRPGSAGSTSVLGNGIGDGITQSGGTGSASFEVRPAFDLPVLDCTEANPCSIIAFENDGQPIPDGGLPSTAVTARIEFARSPADCPAVSAFDVVTNGEASTIHALDSWAAALCGSSTPIVVDTTESSSHAGISDFGASEIDVGVTSIPAEPAPERSVMYAPLNVTAVVVAFNARDTVTHDPIEEMNLSPRLLALMIGGQQIGGPGTQLFQDPEFEQLNPGHNWPGFTHPPLLRGGLNADTRLFTRWFHEDAAARRFLDGNDPAAPLDVWWEGREYPTDAFESHPVLTQYVPVGDRRSVARQLFNFRAPDPSASVSPLFDGLIAVTDVVTAKRFGMRVANLLPANAAPGTEPVAPDTAGLRAGYEAMVPTDGNASVLEADIEAGNAAYPLVKIDYGMVPTSGIDAEKAQDISTFLNYVAGKGQEDDVLPDGYLPLPDDARAQTEDASDAVLAAPNATQGGGFTPVDTTGFGSPTDFGAGGTGSFDDFGSFDDSFGEVGAVAAGDGSGSSADGGASGDDGDDVEPISATFLGSEGHLILPILLVLGLLALAAGPIIAVLERRSGTPAVAPNDADAPADD